MSFFTSERKKNRIPLGARSKGVSAIEAVVGVSIAAMVVLFTTNAIVLFVSEGLKTADRTRALFLAEEGLEAGDVIPASFKATPDGIKKVLDNTLRANLVGNKNPEADKRGLKPSKSDLEKFITL